MNTAKGWGRCLGWICLGLLGMGGVAWAQCDAVPSGFRPSGLWASVSAGKAQQGWGGTMLALNLATQSDALWGVRLGGIFEDIDDKSPDLAVTEAAALVGRRYHLGSLITLNLMTGPALMTMTERGDYLGLAWDDDKGRIVQKYDELSRTTGGWAVDAQLMLPLFRVVGVGLDLFGNLNDDHSYVAASLGLSLGYIH